MIGHTDAGDTTTHFLKRTHGITGFVAHIPNHDGIPICNVKLKLSLWELEDCSLLPVLVCNRCTAAQAKLARS
jgi:hypothetical protein